LRSQNIIPVELSPGFHLDFKVRAPGGGFDRLFQAILREGSVGVNLFFEKGSLTFYSRPFYSVINPGFGGFRLQSTYPSWWLSLRKRALNTPQCNFKCPAVFMVVLVLISAAV
jgi:hypothetical protein